MAIKEPTGKVEVVPGISYYGKTFLRGEVFPINQKKRAIEYSRQRFTEYKEKVYILLVQEQHYLTLWYENPEVTPLPARNNEDFSDFISTVDLNQLVLKMRSKGGVTLKTRRRGFRTFRECFSGPEGINWIQKHLSIARNDAIRLGERLLQEKWLFPLTNHPGSFQSSESLYRFRSD